MSVTPETQHLRPGIDLTLQGLDDLMDALDSRMRDAERWREGHQAECERLHNKLLALRNELLRLRESTL